MELYPKGGLMVINETNLMDKKAERNVEKRHILKKDVNQGRLEENVSERKEKEEETIKRRGEEDERMRQIIKEQEEGIARNRQKIRELEQKIRRLKSAEGKEGKIDFFPTWKPAQGLKNKGEEKDGMEEEEQYLTVVKRALHVF